MQRCGTPRAPGTPEQEATGRGHARGDRGHSRRVRAVRGPETPQLLGVAGTFEEVFFPQGERILRQGLTATGFYVILEGDADVQIDGTKRATLHRGDFFGEVSILLGEPPTADIVATRRCTASSWRPGGRAVPRRPPPVMYRMLQAQARRLRNANRWRSDTRGGRGRRWAARSPGDYPVIVIGSGPGGLQVSYSLRPARHRARGLSADPAPAGCSASGRSSSGCSRGPSRTPRGADAREYQRYDWNSLVAFEPELARSCRVHGRLVVLPVAAGDGGNLAAFAERAAIRGPLRLRWQSTGEGTARTGRSSSSRPRTASTARRPRARGGRRGAVEPVDRRASSSRATTPTPATPRGTPASGSSSSASRTPGFELASGWRWASASITVCSPSPAKLSIEKRTRWPGSGRATSSRSRTTTSASACSSSTRRSSASSRTATRCRVDLKRTDTGEALRVEADEVIAATGFTLPAPRPAGPRRRDVRRSEAAGRDAVWESATVPGICFAGDHHPGVAGPAQARHPGQLGRGPRPPLQRPDPRPPPRGDALRRSQIDRPIVAQERHRPVPPGEATRAPPSCGTTRRTSRGSSRSREDGFRDEGILPLVHALDGDDPGRHGDDRRGGRHGVDLPGRCTSATRSVAETSLPGHPLLDFETPAPRAPAGSRACCMRPPWPTRRRRTGAPGGYWSR